METLYELGIEIALGNYIETITILQENEMKILLICLTFLLPGAYSFACDTSPEAVSARIKVDERLTILDEIQQLNRLRKAQMEVGNQDGVDAYMSKITELHGQLDDLYMQSLQDLENCLN